MSRSQHRAPAAVLLAVAKRLGLLGLTVCAAALISAALVRLAPGFGVDERQLDLRRSEAALEAIRPSQTPTLLGAFGGYLSGLVRGDWGESISLGRPIRGLVRDRAGLTLRTAGSGLLLAWLLAFSATLTLEAVHQPGWEVAATLTSGALLCLPASVVALLFLYLDWGPAAALAAILFPRLFRYVRGILHSSSLRPHVLAARARGVGTPSLVWRHTCVPAASELLALAGVSVSMVAGAIIPVEALCDSPGVGQLVWQAATARDLPMLMHLTVIVAFVASMGNLFADAFRIILPRAVG